MEDVRHWWASYKRDGNDAARNKLWEHYLPLVQHQARRLSAKLPSTVELDDLIAAGCFGLMEALAGFDLERGIKFETYSPRRIRGAILDHLRSMDWVPRLERSRAKEREQVRDALTKRLGRRPTDEEIATKIGLSTRERSKFYKQSQPVRVVSLGGVRYTSDSDKELLEADLILDKKQASPFTAAERQDLRQFITKTLVRAERLIVLLYYYEEMTMKEIGRTLALSESRVSQMHTSIMARLRAHLSQHPEAAA